ncbi:MAG: ribosome biogenesis GTPase Der [Bacteroidales bacterium]|jgi:GTP-binding protein|nr:ribosome biogenesis GTPase Der [Bacteroidales bacterium]
MNNLVAIVGRPNVGKSTLFNRLTQSRQAIVTDIAGTTRDRLYGKVIWNDLEFSLVDTGGWIIDSDDVLEDQINRQVKIAIEEADVILLTVDVMAGLTDLDSVAAQMLRRSGKPVIIVANKADTHRIGYQSAEFYSLGLGDPFEVSSINGLGTGDLLDHIISKLNRDKEVEELDANTPKFAVVGRPNAGKSSLVNSLLDEERNIVTDIAGTTRDSIHTHYTKFGMNFYLIDTAGIRKKGKVDEDLEYYSVIRSIRVIEEADVCILMIDATRGIESQDLNIFSLIQKNRKGLVVFVNKWDTVEEKTNESMKFFEKSIRFRLAPFTDFPILFGSATTKQRILKLMDLAKDVYVNKKARISTSKLNEEMLPIIQATPPPSNKGKYIKVKYITQLRDTQIPSFVFFCNLPQYIKEPYKRFIENRMREKWNFTGTPINIFFREK